jgi:aspartyl-tRNA(Asn)/glutamyl-tRNA(Gln) amidotransferase subunit A
LFEFSSIEQYHAQLKEGRTTCVQAVEYYLDRIKSFTHLNAFITVYAEEILGKAKELDEDRRSGKPLGKLHGVVIGIKDVICYQGHKISAASHILKDFTAVYSATAIGRLIAEEALIIGNLNCDEFAMGSTNENSAYGRVLNALDESRVAGGSSGGSAVAVQAGLCMIALGSDTGGSVRLPASFCGIVGFKPSYGRISRYGLIAYASSFEQIGILGRSIPDIALLLEVMAGEDDFDSTISRLPVPVYSKNLLSEKKFRFAYFPVALEHPALDPEIGSAIQKTIDNLKLRGYEVEPIEFDLIDHIVPAYYVLTTAEASSNLARYDGIKYGYADPNPDLDLIDFYKMTRSKGFGKEVKRRIMLGTFVLSSGYYDAYFTRAQKVRRMLSNRIYEIFKEFDFILLPTSPTIAPKAGQKINDAVSSYLTDIYTVVANLTGIPAISLPLYKHRNDMPFGLQILSNRFNELSLFQVSESLFKPSFVP